MNSYGVSNMLFSKAGAKKLPINGTFELTSNCNFNCRMCYVHSCKCKSENIGFNQWKHLIDEACENGLNFKPNDCTHSFSSSTVAPTCDCFGYTESVCSSCGYVQFENITEPTEHSFSDWTVTEQGGYCRTCNECKQSENLPILYGDLNCDAKSDGEDAVIAQAMLNNLLGLSPAADCNRNGGIDDDDIQLIVMSGLFLGEIEQGY